MLMGKQDKQGTPDQGKSNIPIPDPITVGEARKILGVSTVKMSKLLSNGTLPWTQGILDQRFKYVSKQATLDFKRQQPVTNKATQSRGGTKAPAQSTKQAIPLAEWLDALKISYQDLARRSREWAAKQHPGPIAPGARRAEILEGKGVSLPTIRKIARKQQYPLPVTVQRLAEALGITSEQLLTPPE